MKVTASDLKRFKVIDQIISEPVGGAHRAPQEAMESAGRAIESVLKEFDGVESDEIRRRRREKFIAMGRSL